MCLQDCTNKKPWFVQGLLLFELLRLRGDDLRFLLSNWHNIYSDPEKTPKKEINKPIISNQKPYANEVVIWEVYGP